MYKISKQNTITYCFIIKYCFNAVNLIFTILYVFIMFSKR